MKHIVVTGAAGFIGSNLVRRLNKEGHAHIIVTDDFTNPAKNKNLEGVKFSQQIERNKFIEWLTENSNQVSFIFHLGARTDTSEFNFRILDSLNLSYSKALWEICTIKQIPLLYASSAATYGMGEHGFSDAHALIRNLKPLNPYGLSKHLFDLFVLEQKQTPPFWCGLKFFNVYGPYEFHKGRMASVVLHAYKQITDTGKVKLFKSHHPGYKDGEQLRDFVYIDDVLEICLHFYKSFTAKGNCPSGIYNAGSGIARTFKALAEAIFTSLYLSPQIEYIPTPTDIRDKYQYYTQADISKLLSTKYTKKITLLEEGVNNYTHFLKNVQ